MTDYRYERIFDPTPPAPVDRDRGLQGGDSADDSPYVYDEDIILTVNVALAARRPLLVAGPPGAGKSSLAANVARHLGVPYRGQVITARTEARDLEWRFDAVRRLRDATAGDRKMSLDPRNYLARGVMWEAFAASSAGQGIVVLLDEIDKADPDVPNSLLETLGAGRFYVDEIDEWIEGDDEVPPFIVITTNDERELSRPFLRRCVMLTLPLPKPSRLVAIAESWGLAGGADRAIAEALADQVVRLAREWRAAGAPLPGTAEYLDALRAVLTLGVTLDSPTWEAVTRATLRKRIEETEQEQEGGA